MSKLWPVSPPTGHHGTPLPIGDTGMPPHPLGTPGRPPTHWGHRANRLPTQNPCIENRQKGTTLSLAGNVVRNNWTPRVQDCGYLASSPSSVMSPIPMVTSPTMPGALQLPRSLLARSHRRDLEVMVGGILHRHMRMLQHQRTRSR